MSDGNENEPLSPHGGGPREADAKRGARGLALSVIALLVTIGALIVLALATQTDAPVVRQAGGAGAAAEPAAAGHGGILGLR